MNEIIKRKKCLLIVIIVCELLGTLLRVTYILRNPVEPRDSYQYKNVIFRWDDQNVLPEENNGILSLWLLKIPHHLFDYDILYSGSMINTALSFCIILLTITNFFELFGRIYPSLIAGIIVSTHPQLIKYSVALLRENSYLLLSILFLQHLIRYYRVPQMHQVIVLGIISATTVLCRLEGFEFAVISAFFLLFGKNCSFKNKLVRIASFFAIYIVTLSVIMYSLNINPLFVDYLSKKMILK